MKDKGNVLKLLIRKAWVLSGNEKKETAYKICDFVESITKKEIDSRYQRFIDIPKRGE